MRRFESFCRTGPVALAACGIAVVCAACVAPAPDDLGESELAVTETPEAIYLWTGEIVAEGGGGAADATPRLLYLNRAATSYRQGVVDSSANTWPWAPAADTIVAAWHRSDAEWQTVVRHVRELFVPFDVDVTEVDPGATPHMEVKVGGLPSVFSFRRGVLGVSPFNCREIPRSIVFVFSENPYFWDPNFFQDPLRAIAETVAQEVGHSFGLDHEYLCLDPMTYLDGCGRKSFQNVDARCGEGATRACECGRATQNSYRLLPKLSFLRGDANGSGRIDISDSQYITNWLFSGGPAPACLDSADSNDDGRIDLSDAIYVNSYLFLGGRAPPAPFPTAGPDPTPDLLSCRRR